MIDPQRPKSARDIDVQIAPPKKPRQQSFLSFLWTLLCSLVNRITKGSPSSDEASETSPTLKVTVGPEAMDQLIADRQLALTRVHSTLDAIKTDLQEFFPKVPEVFAPRIVGVILNPNGSPARNVSVEAQEPEYTAEEKVTSVAWPKPRALTDARGTFRINMPRVPIPMKGLRFLVRGENASSEFSFARIQLTMTRLGIIPLDKPLTSLPKSIVSSLKEIVPASEEDVDEDPGEFAEPAPALTLGSGDCAYSFRSNSGVIDRFGYSMLVRLIEPQVTPKQLVMRRSLGDGRFDHLLPSMAGQDIGYNYEAFLAEMLKLGFWTLVDRVPVDRPIDVADFRDSIERDVERVPKASSLGLGYILKMHQVWIPAGLSLGDMLYALALAPGEQERVAIFEKKETLSVRDAESMTFDESQRFRESADSSALATFNSTAYEYVKGHSKMDTDASSWGVGGAGGVGALLGPVLFGVGAAGGYGSSSSGGDTTSWQRATRDYASSASQDFHSELSRQAASRRRANRTGVRLASASEREQITTKVITNHNHCHALTMQYWEVLRHYSVSSQLDDVKLVCFVPLEVVQFLPSGQPRTLPAGTYTRSQLLTRYAMLIRFHDVLASQLRYRPRYAHGLKLLNTFASNPTTTIQDAANGLAQDVISLKVTGTFLPFEEIHVSVVSKSGARVGPIKLAGPAMVIAPEVFSTKEELLSALRDYRTGDTGETKTASLALPDYIARHDLARIEFTRRFLPFTYKLKPAQVDLAGIGALVGPLGEGIGRLLQANAVERLLQSNAVFNASDLEQLVGAPYVWDATGKLEGTNLTCIDAFPGRGAAESMPGRLPIPMLRIPPILSFADLLHIESTFQHVMTNTVTYSKAVWMSLTPEERAILLERFTIGVPAGGITDASQEVPLLNCVANEVLGFYGNAAVMPFYIPPALAESMGITSRDVQDALLKFHRQAFRAPQSSITLPADGMLGEAVLGSCTSCEKIDLTRFWNWQDSPSDTVEALKAGDFKGQSLVGNSGATAPSTLASAATQPVNINAVSMGANAPAPTSNLLEQLIGRQPVPTAFSDITGLTTLQKQQQLTLEKADAARKEALDQAHDMASKVITELPKVMLASAGIDAENKKSKEEEEKAKSEKEKAKAESEKAAAGEKAKAQEGAISKLNSNAASYSGLVGAVADDAAALEKAKTLVSGIFGDSLPPLADLAIVFDKFKAGPNDDAEMRRGKAIMLKALGLSN